MTDDCLTPVIASGIENARKYRAAGVHSWGECWVLENLKSPWWVSSGLLALYWRSL